MYSKNYIVNQIPGIIFVSILSLISYFLASIPLMEGLGISSLVLAILLGIIVGNSWSSHPASLTPGIQFSAKRILRLAIILYGFRVTYQQIASIGIEAIVIDITVVSSTLLIGYFVGRKLLKLDRDIALLISIGSAICGAAAVLAAEDILKSEPYKTALAVGTVVLFGTTAMFLYPILQKAGLLHFSISQYGVYSGASVHEVAQALVAGANVSPEASKIAVIVKMMRVLLLVPVLVIFSILFSNSTPGNNKSVISIPWFAVGFVVVIGINSLNVFSISSIKFINELDTFLLTMAMGAIGFETKFSKLKHVGITPLYLSLILFAWLMGSTYLMVRVS